MDFVDILRIFVFIMIPIGLKAIKESKNASKKYTSGNTREAYHTKRITKEPEINMADDNSAQDTMKETKIEHKKAPRRSLESKGYNEEDHIKSRSSLESSDYTVKKRKNDYQPTKNSRKKKVKDVIIENEIGSEKLELNFDKSELVRGIVMSEILAKPKSLRK